MGLFKSNRIKTTTLKSGKELQIYLLPALKGYTLAKEIASLALPTLSVMIDNGDDVSLTQAAAILVASLENVDEQAFIKALLANFSIDGQEVDIDEYFAGNYGELNEILLFALKENFSSFFDKSASFKELKSKLSAMQQGIAAE